MDRIQEIISKRLEQKKEKEWKIYHQAQVEELQIQEQFEKLYNWILDLLEKPTEYNTLNEVILNDSFYHKVQVGDRSSDPKSITELEFCEEVMQRLEKTFKDEKGFDANYCKGRAPNYYAKLTVRIL